MNLSHFLPVLSLAFVAPALAGPINNIDWDCEQSKIVKALRESSDASIAENVIHPKDIVAGGFVLNKQYCFQSWKGYFKFDPKTSKLAETIFVGSQGYDPELLDGPLKSYYMFVAQDLKSAFKLTDKAKNLPHYGNLTEVSAVDFYPMHSYTVYEKFITLGWFLDKKSNTIHAAFSLKQAAIKTGLGLDAQNPNVKGTEKEWEGITPWTELPEADEFLIKAGLKVAKPETPAKDDAPATEDSGEDNFAADDQSSAEDEFDAKTQASIESIDKTLSADDQELLLAICEKDNGNEGAFVKHLITAAQASNARALYLLAKCFEEGTGIAKNEEKAKTSMLAAAQMGYAPALVNFGAEFKTAMASLGYTEAEGAAVIQELEKAAELQSVAARMSLAMMYRYGFGMRKDIDKARAMLEALELQGDLEASNLLDKKF